VAAKIANGPGKIFGKSKKWQAILTTGTTKETVRKGGPNNILITGEPIGAEIHTTVSAIGSCKDIGTPRVVSKILQKWTGQSQFPLFNQALITSSPCLQKWTRSPKKFF